MDEQTLRLLLSLAKGKHEWSKADDRSLLLGDHPYADKMRNDDPTDTFFLGDIGATDSCGLLLNWLIDQIIDGHRIVRVWEFRYQAPDAIGDDCTIQIQFDTEAESAICDGMTNYSGEGKAAYEVMQTAITALRRVYDDESHNCPLHFVVVNHSEYRSLEEFVYSNQPF